MIFKKNAPRLQGVPRGALRVARGGPQTPHAGHAVWHVIWHGQRSGQHPVFGTSRQSFTCCVTKAFNDEDHTVCTQNPSISEKWENPRAYCDIMSELPVFAMLAVCVCVFSYPSTNWTNLMFARELHIHTSKNSDCLRLAATFWLAKVALCYTSLRF